MSVDRATIIWNEVIQGDEGYLDAMARLEAEGRALTDRERQAADVLWVHFIETLKAMADVR
ncbi:MAG TPA: hypothetical protein DIT48_00585 [Actinobacteria bacterium]|jgi:hypothetical protein|nr:hypothetical protein [Actinomycetota bacterium]